ncbi:MAG: hypothetical protein LUE63_07825 [Lachnospiraceae bacterium]|nr:hypothetical protein [Lachnospiraceae bacterium]
MDDTDILFMKGGKQKSFYSWELEPTDKLPAGKRECVALRDQIAEYRRFKDRAAYLGVLWVDDIRSGYEATHDSH